MVSATVNELPNFCIFIRCDLCECLNVKGSKMFVTNKYILSITNLILLFFILSIVEIEVANVVP